MMRIYLFIFLTHMICREKWCFIDFDNENNKKNLTEDSLYVYVDYLI